MLTDITMTAVEDETHGHARDEPDDRHALTSRAAKSDEEFADGAAEEITDTETVDAEDSADQIELIQARSTDNATESDDAVRVDEPADMQRLQRQLEALMFIASEPVPIERLAKLCGSTLETTTVAIGALEADYAERGIQVRLLAGGYRFATAPDVRDAVEAYLLPPKTSLSPAALETLAIIAYSQPVTRADIEQVRGVSVDGIVAGLVERGFVAEIGRKESAGRPVLFGTTPGFLEAFGLPSLADLPPLPEERVDQLTRETALAPVLEGTIDEPDAQIVADGEASAEGRDEDIVMNAVLEEAGTTVATMDPIEPIAPIGPTETVPEVGPIDPVSPMPPIDPGPSDPMPDLASPIEPQAVLQHHRNDKDAAYVEAVAANSGDDVIEDGADDMGAREIASGARWN